MSRSSSKLKVINLLGAPGMGKSALAGALFGYMKRKHMSVELCREYAKYLVITGREWQLKEEQLYLFGKQHHELFILRGKYEYAVTDSPLILTAFYADKNTTPASFFPCVKEYNDTFDNQYFFITRNLKNAYFEEEGRMHNKEQSLKVEKEQLQFIKEWGIKYQTIVLEDDIDKSEEIYKKIMDI